MAIDDSLERARLHPDVLKNLSKNKKLKVAESYSEDNPPPYPVTSVNGQTGDVDIPTVDLPLPISEGGHAATTAAQAAKNLGVLPLGEVVTKIPANADFNDYDLPGVYAVRNNNVAATIANIPQQNGGILRVFSGLGSDITPSATGKYLLQEYIDYAGARYQRCGESGYGTTVTWGAWETIYENVRNLSITATAGSGVMIRSFYFHKIGRIVFGYIYFDVTSALYINAPIATLSGSLPNPYDPYVIAPLCNLSGPAGMAYIARGQSDLIKTWGETPVGTYNYAQFIYVAR